MNKNMNKKDELSDHDKIIAIRLVSTIRLKLLMMIVVVLISFIVFFKLITI